MLFPPLERYVSERVGEFSQIPEEHQTILKRLARYVEEGVKSGRPVELVFICTHNSRRSQMSQIWAQTAAHYYAVPSVRTYSAGTEATAFNPRAVAAMQRAGLQIEPATGGTNPVYRVRFGEGAEPMELFSKVVGDPRNPRTGFCAIMTCSQADQACPSVPGASARLAVAYDDPGAFDGTEKETGEYDTRCQQVARDMLYAFSLVEA